MNIYGWKKKIERAKQDFKEHKIGARECVHRKMRYREKIKRLRQRKKK